MAPRQPIGASRQAQRPDMGRHMRAVGQERHGVIGRPQMISTTMNTAVTMAAHLARVSARECPRLERRDHASRCRGCAGRRGRYERDRVP